jgi:hypothetical protein
VLTVLRPNYYVPRNPWQTPSYYPQSVIPVLESSTIFSQLEVETLFYIFYYQPGTYKQCVWVPCLSCLPLTRAQVSRCEGAQEAVVAIPCQVHDLVSTALRAASHHGRVRAGRLRLL